MVGLRGQRAGRPEEIAHEGTRGCGSGRGVVFVVLLLWTDNVTGGAAYDTDRGREIWSIRRIARLPRYIMPYLILSLVHLPDHPTPSSLPLCPFSASLPLARLSPSFPFPPAPLPARANPTVHAALPSNTLAIYGPGQTKELTELVPGILNQLGPDSLANLRRLAESYQSLTARNAAASAAAGGAGAGAGREGEVDDEDDEGIPDLVENFEDAGEGGKTAADLEELE